MYRKGVAPGEYLHIFNRGVLKQNIFLNDQDRYRFLFLILFFQSTQTLKNLDRMFKDFLKNPEFCIASQKDLLESRSVELISFCLMKNHFHLLVKELKDGGVSKYMQRIQNSFTKYFNVKYDKSGHLFQGAYKSVHIVSNEQLLHASVYIHKNPKELKDFKNSYDKFYWCSYQDYLGKNRWGDFLEMDDILLQFKDSDEYEKFVKTSLAKEDNIL